LPGDDAAALLTRPDLRLGISTPGNDPSGDYAVAALDRLAPGLGDRALRLTGAPGLPRAPQGRNPYAWVLDTGAADLFLTYRTNAVAAIADTPGLRMLDLPEAIQIRATYALTTRIDAGPAAEALARRVLSPETQGLLAALGFDPVPVIPSPGVPA
jgi:ABC-type molybdate transport system substrate-binding protein